MKRVLRCARAGTAAAEASSADATQAPPVAPLPARAVAKGLEPQFADTTPRSTTRRKHSPREFPG
jgi:hypothetical protein